MSTDIPLDTEGHALFTESASHLLAFATAGELGEMRAPVIGDHQPAPVASEFMANSGDALVVRFEPDAFLPFSNSIRCPWIPGCPVRRVSTEFHPL